MLSQSSGNLLDPLSSNLGAFGHPEMRHPIEHRAFQQELFELSFDRPRTQAIAKDGLETKHQRFNQ